MGQASWPPVPAQKLRLGCMLCKCNIYKYHISRNKAFFLSQPNLKHSAYPLISAFLSDCRAFKYNYCVMVWFSQIFHCDSQVCQNNVLRRRNVHHMLISPRKLNHCNKLLLESISVAWKTDTCLAQKERILVQILWRQIPHFYDKARAERSFLFHQSMGQSGISP